MKKNKRAQVPKDGRTDNLKLELREYDEEQLEQMSGGGVLDIDATTVQSRFGKSVFNEAKTSKDLAT